MQYLGRLASLILVSLAATSASADIINLEASDNATVRPGGPRTGTSGKTFFNIEGNSFGTNSSFGVADFTFTAPSTAYTSISSIQFQLTQSNASFSATGGLLFYLSTATGVDIQPGSSLAYTAVDNPNGPGSQLNTLYALGSAIYTVGTTGDIDTFNLALPNSSAESYLLNLINSGGTARFVITPGGDGVAATYSGFSNATLAGPTVIINATAVPEPSMMVVLALSGVACIGARYRNRMRQHDADSVVA